MSQQVGDRVQVIAVPWNRVVARPSDEPGPLMASAVVVGTGALVLWCIALMRRGRRFRTGGAKGWEYAGRVVQSSSDSLAVRLDSGARLNLLPAAHTQPLVVGERVAVYACRRSWFLRQPGGPWVVAVKPGHDRATVFTHGWISRKA